MSQSALAFAPFLAIGEITVRQHDGLYSLNDLHQAAGGNPTDRPGNFLRRKETKALIAAVGACSDLSIPLQTTNDGENNGTYACRELVIAYAAWISAAFHLKVIRVFLAVAAPTTPYSVGPNDTLSEDQAQALRAILTENANRLPKDKQGAAIMQGWSKLKSHFGVPYRQIPAREFNEAVSLLTRHVIAWEVMDEPAPQPQPTAFGQAMVAAHSSALQYFSNYRAAVDAGQRSAEMPPIPTEVLEGLVAESLMQHQFLAGLDYRTGQMGVRLVPRGASVFDFQDGDFAQAVSAIPTKRLPDLQDALNKRIARHLGAIAH